MNNTQVEKIVSYSRSFGWISQREAYRLGIYRLASRISDMKRAGYRIMTEYARVENADGTSSRIARYKVIATPYEVIHNVVANV